MIENPFSRSAQHHEHAEPAQRVLGVEALPPDSPILAQLLADDPAPEVRLAAARRCVDLAALGRALAIESDSGVRAALEFAAAPWGAHPTIIRP